MIVRILLEGQYVVTDELLDEMNEADDRIMAAVEAQDQKALTEALGELLSHVRASGSPVDDDLLIDSDVILPGPDATVAELQEIFEANGDGLIPG